MKNALAIIILSLFTTPAYSQQKLLEAIEKKDTVAFDRILASGYNVNKRDLKIQTRFAVPVKFKRPNGKIVKDKTARRGTPLIRFQKSDLPLTEAAFTENYYFTEQLPLRP